MGSGCVGLLTPAPRGTVFQQSEETPTALLEAI